MGTIRVQDLEERLRELATGLFALEVNTIVKANMTGVRWSSTTDALTDIAASYHAKLTALRVDHVAPAGAPLVDIAALGDAAARAGDAAASAGRSEGDTLMLARIRNNAAMVARIFAGREGDLTSGLPADQFVTLRKIWEIGAEEIVMQTVIHIDGDVMTRVQPDKVGDAELCAIHDASVATSVKLWQGLVSTLRVLAENVVAWFK
jgi:hypothetical protein